MKFRRPYRNIFKTLVEKTGKSRRNKFLDIYNPLKLNQEDINKLNIYITSNEIETVLKNLPTKKMDKGERWKG
jgi:hypothetical protein